MAYDTPSPKDAPAPGEWDASDIDVDDVRIRVDSMISDAEEFDSSERSPDRDLALAYIDGEMPDLESKAGKSNTVEEILADAMAWLLPNIARIFQSSDHIARYEAVAPRGKRGMPAAVFEAEVQRGKDFAQQSTQYINDRFLKDCHGEKVLRDGFYNGFLHGNGILKHYWDSSPHCEYETYTGLSDEQYRDLLDDQDVEVLNHSERPDLTAMAISATSAPALAAPGGGGAGLGQALPGGPGGLAGGGGGGGGLPNGPLGGPPLVPQPVQQPQANGLAAGIGAEPATPYPPPPLNTRAPVPPSAPGMPPGAPDLAGLLGGLLGAAAPPPPPMRHDLKIRRTISTGRFVVKALADEDFLIESAATALNEHECRFCAHRDTPTRSELIKQGLDPQQVWDLGSDENRETDRIRSGTNYTGIDDYDDKAGERVTIYECYAQLDLDGDGITEWYQVKVGGHMGAREVLQRKDGTPCIEVWGGRLPFTDLVPDPVPHRWRGRSLYKRLRQPQRVATALARRVNDNIYQTVEPMRAVDLEKVRNKDAIFNPKLGQVIITDGPPSEIIQDLAVPFVAKEAIPLIEEQRKVAERRVGVGEQSAGLDPDAMQHQVATSITAMQTASSLRKEDYARCLQIGMQRLFSCLLRLSVENQDRPEHILMNNQWVEVDPRGWSAEMDVIVNTGLGAGNRDRDLMMLTQIATAQKEVLLQVGPMLGLDNPIMSVSNLFTTYRMACEAAGVKAPELFFPELTPEILQQASAQIQQKQAEQQKNDPKMQAEQRKLQVQQQKAVVDAQLATQKQQSQQQFDVAELQHKQALAEAEMQRKVALQTAEQQGRLQAEQARAESDVMIARERSMMEIQAQREQAQQQAQLATAKARSENELAQAKAQFEAELAMRQAHFEAQLAERELMIEERLKARQIAQPGRSPAETEVRRPEHE